MNLGEPIAEGRTAEVYSWGDGWVLKLFHTWVSEESVQYEARVNRAVHAAGLAVPTVGEVIEVEGRDGCVAGVTGAAAERRVRQVGSG